jgi:hypothetical protein
MVGNSERNLSLLQVDQIQEVLHFQVLLSATVIVHSTIEMPLIEPLPLRQKPPLAPRQCLLVGLIFLLGKNIPP